MKTPKFKFKLHVYKPVDIHEFEAYDGNGSLVQENDKYSTGIITEPGFKIPDSFIGSDVIVTMFDIINNEVYAVREQIRYSIFSEQHNNFIFDETLQAIAFTFTHDTIDSIDKNNFLLYKYNVHPDFSKLAKVWSRAADEMYMRWSLQGNLKFKGEAFDLIASLPNNRFIKLVIERYNYENEQYEEYFRTTKFTKLNCEFDYDRRLVTPSFQPDDEYSNVLSCINDEYDIKKLKARSSKTFYKIPPMVQTYIKGSKTITNIIGCSYFTQDVTLPDPSDDQTEEQLLESFGFGKVNNTFEYDIHIIYNGITSNEHFLYTADGRILSQTHLIFDTKTRDDSPYYIKMESWWDYSDNAQKIIFRLYLTSNDTLIAYSDTVRCQNFGDYSIGGTQLRNGNTIVGFINIPITYDVYERLLFYNSGDTLISQATGFLAEEDFAYSGSVYNAHRKLNTTWQHDIMTFDQYSIQYEASASRSIEPGQYALTKEGIYYFTGRDIETTTNERLIPICYDAWGGISIWAKASVSNDTQTYNTFGFSFINRDTYALFSVLKAIFAEIAPNVNVYEDVRSSEFFFRFPLLLEEVMPIFTHLSNIEAGDFYYCAAKLKIKLKDIFDFLKNTYRCYWFIDKTNTLRIEHISWFYNGFTSSAEPNVLTDLTIEKDEWNKKSLHLGQNTIKYVDDELYKQLTYSADSDTTDAFDDFTVKLNDTFLDTKESNSIVGSSFKTNIDYIFATADANRNDGIVVLFCNKAATTITQYDYVVTRFRYFDSSMLSDNGNKYVIRPSNTTAIPRYALNYYMYDFYGYELNTLAYETKGIKRIRRQSLTYPLHEDALPDVFVNSYIITKYGLGLINSLSIDFDTQYANVEVSYNDADYQWDYERLQYQSKILYSETWDDFKIPVMDEQIRLNQVAFEFYNLLSTQSANFSVDISFMISSIDALSLGEQLPIFSTTQNYDNSNPLTFFGVVIQARQNLTHRWDILAGRLNKNGAEGYVIWDELATLKTEIDLANMINIRFDFMRVIHNNNDSIKCDVILAESQNDVVSNTQVFSGYSRFSSFWPAPSYLTLHGDINDRIKIKSIRVMKR